MAKATARVRVDQGRMQAIAIAEGLSQVKRLGRRVVARAKMLAPVDTGYLRNSIRSTASVSGSHAFLDVKVGAKYGRFVHDGTKPHIIRAKTGGVLAFPGAGGVTVFAREVHHPGTRARPFLKQALDEEGRRAGFTIRSG